MKAIIIDDLIEARENLKKDLKTYCSQIKIIGEAEGVISGAKLLKKANPDVIFLDIQMQDGTGFDFLDIVGNITAKVIFTTASDEFAIKAFKFSAVDYLLKPIDPDELISAIKKVDLASKIDRSNYDLLLENIKTQNTPKKIALNTLEKIHIKRITEIVRCESNVNYTKFYFSDGGKLLVTKTLKEFDKMLSEHGFIRIHQSHLINTNFVKEYVKIDGGYLVMTDGSNVPVSTRKKNNVMEMISNL